jgi:hypothetical protein
VDIQKNPNFIRDFVAVAERINLTACLLTPYSHRVQVAEAAKQLPRQIVPFGFIDLDATDVLSQVKDFTSSITELEFVKRPLCRRLLSAGLRARQRIWLGIAVPYGHRFCVEASINRSCIPASWIAKAASTDSMTARHR